MTRTTLALDGDILDLVRNLANSRGISMGEAANVLIRRGFEAREKTTVRNGFAVFGSEGGQKFSLADIEAAEEQADLESTRA